MGALPDAHEGEASGVLGGMAHKLADFAKGVVGGLRSNDVDVLGNPDGGVPVAETAEAAAVHTPICSHAQAVEERRARTAPALAVAGLDLRQGSSMDKADPTARAAQEQAKRNRRYLFAAIDAVTITSRDLAANRLA